MRTLPALVALAAASTLVLSGCTDASQTGAGTGDPAADQEAAFDTSAVETVDEIAALLPADVAESGTLRVGSSTDYAPAEFIGPDGRTPVGYDIDIITAVGAVLGLEVDVQSADFPSIIPALGSKFDVGISSFTITEERVAQANMISYFNAGEAFAVLAGNPEGIDPADVCGYTVAVQTGTVEDEGADALSAECEAAGDEPLDVLRYDSQADATTNVVGGKADILYADSPIVAYAVQQTEGALEPLGDTFASAPQGVVTAKDDTQLAEAVQAALQHLVDDGTFAEILETWGNEDGGLETIELNPTLP
ncbi:ABC transporter substrate-binding protein [Oerskovia flava]|uniref:ABC transporter substrate-binding protein n=1 Tax=Oerskovia flava TaxID=2986422 RepID=UPI00223EEF76|nr:ABC transporter substrate-binding protein [Oerskovia sp. JB1-3-2]